MFLVDRDLKRVLQEGSVRIIVDEDVFPPKDNPGNTRGISLLTAVFLMVIAGCFPTIIQEFPVRPFPSVPFIISTVLVCFCAVCLVALNWKR